jgi:hypothetical protein
MKLKRAKCVFGLAEVKCLGASVGAAGIRPDNDKVDAILHIPTPHSIKDLRSFLGMASYYRSFIPNFGSLTHALYALTKTKTAYTWTPELGQAFVDVKLALANITTLRLPNFQQPFCLHTDRSTIAVGAVLSQIDPEDNIEYPVAFASRALTSAEANYSATEGELLAIVWATHKFRVYLHGNKFTIYCDHVCAQTLGVPTHS